MILTGELIQAFAGTYLSGRYDHAVASPDFHLVAWDLYASSVQSAGCIAPREHAKAQPLDRKVLTPLGWRAIGDLRVGDRVIGSDGKATAVTHLHPIAEMPIYRVTTTDGRETECNGEHLWTVQIPSNTGERFVTKSLNQLLPLYRLWRFEKRTQKQYFDCRVFLPLVKPVEFGETPTLAIDPYVLGVWLGDGHSAGGRITSDDPEIFQWFPYEVAKQSGKYLYGVKGLSADLKRLGLLNNKHIPQQCFGLSVMDRLRLLQGLMDTDGTCHQDGNIAYFGNTNRNLIQGVMELVRSLGGIAVINEAETKCNGKMFDSWKVSVKLDMNPFRMSRKAAQWKGSVNMRISVCDICPMGTKASRCITVAASDGLYVTDDYILTHNSTALTFAYIMAETCFRKSMHVVLIGSTEDKAAEQLSNISEEFHENADIRRDFGIREFQSDTKGEIIVSCEDGHRFRILARGAEQKIRGTIWNGGRPDLIVGDDVEDDEQVESVDRRRKFRNWFFRAAKPALSVHGRIRIHGTILHEDSLLSRLRKNNQWTMLFYQAHAGYSDFSNILWPQQWTEQRLRNKQAEFEAEGDAEGYSQEYLNNPLDTKNAYFRKQQFHPMTETDHSEDKLFYVGCDFAVSKAERANKTAFIVGGKDSRGTVHHVDARVGRWESVAESEDETGWIDQLFDIQKVWSPELFFVEDGVVWKALWPLIRQEMARQDCFINFVPCIPKKDKGVRAGSLQARMKAGVCKFDMEADWFGAYQDELLRFQPSKQAQADDQVDGTAWMHIGLDSLGDIDESDFMQTDDIEMEEHAYHRANRDGVSHVTGY